ncbi:hypothetical protein [Candidatus Mycoplasma haematohominis]|uniref:Uncharacterized protein n=1 Tax=Candidatus Mycoplasma haematohominis TaxID=1494318 RepID=A0A478FSN6_9MOLU|nr:hypothetical protein [Candidatus Mycoplasma haemohominis]GCE63479.1 hypothetical protein MHSWG343_04760 [Candidatus Mycoplasma haemohominis]
MNTFNTCLVGIVGTAVGVAGGYSIFKASSSKEESLSGESLKMVSTIDKLNAKKEEWYLLRDTTEDERAEGSLKDQDTCVVMAKVSDDWYKCPEYKEFNS